MDYLTLSAPEPSTAASGFQEETLRGVKQQNTGKETEAKDAALAHGRVL